jgi:hypothetical protein
VSADKILILYGLLAKKEPSYNAGATLSAATDGVQLAEPAEATLSYVHDGARGTAPGNAGTLKRVAQSGGSAEISLSVEGRGLGSAYGASALPEIDALLRAAGHGATVVTTSGAETVTYAPVSASFASLALECYSRGQKWPMSGAYLDMGFSLDGPGLLMFNFDVSALFTIPTDVSCPSITYSAVSPPKGESIAMAIGSWSNAVVRKLSFKANRARSPRANVNAAGHAGFSPGRRAPTLEVTVEACALATFDPYTVRKNATSLALSMLVGATLYNKIAFSAAQAQLVDVKEESDEATALWTLSFALATSTPVANDDYSLVYS